jgi:hypothetical protein
MLIVLLQNLGTSEIDCTTTKLAMMMDQTKKNCWYGLMCMHLEWSSTIAGMGAVGAGSCTVSTVPVQTAPSLLSIIAAGNESTSCSWKTCSAAAAKSIKLDEEFPASDKLEEGLKS